MGGGFRIASWRVDPQLNTIARNGASVRVEPKVMAVLVRLAEQAPDAVSHEQLLQSVWPGIFVSDDVLTRCVSELRRVFEDDARESHIIQTIPKRGYRLVVPVEQDQQQGRELASDSCNPLFYCILIWNSVWRRCAAHAVRICAPD